MIFLASRAIRNPDTFKEVLDINVYELFLLHESIWDQMWFNLPFFFFM